MLNENSPEVVAFLKAWHENGRKPFERNYTNLNYDEYAPKVATARRKFIALDERKGSGRFLADRMTGNVYTIKAYGVPNRCIGTLASLTAHYMAATATQVVA